MTEKTRDGATTALRRWSKRWKALAKRYRCSNAYYHEKADEFESRIEELTAELERTRADAQLAHAAAKEQHGSCFAQIESWKEMSQKADIRAAASKAGWKNECEAHQKAREALATERAAREALSSANGLLTHDISDLHDQLEQAERERNTALADAERMRRTRGDRDEWVQAAQRADTARIAAETALASARAYAVSCSRNSQEDSARREAAETALASARELLERLGEVIEDYGPGRQFDTAADALDAIIQLRTSHPAPVAPTTDATCVDWAKHWGEVAEGKRHPWHENACAPVAAPRAGCHDYEILVENLKFRLKMAEDSNPDNVLSKHNAMLMAIEQRDEYKRNWEACHRQHEQCMKLLQRCFCYLPKACKLENLVGEMLSKGELPEGWDE